MLYTFAAQSVLADSIRQGCFRSHDSSTSKLFSNSMTSPLLLPAIPNLPCLRLSISAKPRRERYRPRRMHGDGHEENKQSASKSKDSNLFLPNSKARIVFKHGITSLSKSQELLSMKCIFQNTYSRTLVALHTALEHGQRRERKFPQQVQNTP